MLASAHLICACGSPPVPETKTAVATNATEAPVSLTFKMFAVEGTGQRVVASGETLRSGDRLTMEITVDRPAFGYVLQFFPDGSAAVLFPQGNEDNRLTSTARLPRTGWFELDEVIGTETVYVVASTRPLAEVDASVLAVVDHVRTTNSPPAADDVAAATGSASTPALGSAAVADQPSGAGSAITATGPVVGKHGGAGGPLLATKKPGAGGAPAPGRASLRTRGLVRVEDSAQVIARTDADGLAIFHVSFQHAARN